MLTKGRQVALLMATITLLAALIADMPAKVDFTP